MYLYNCCMFSFVILLYVNEVNHSAIERDIVINVQNWCFNNVHERPFLCAFDRPPDAGSKAENRIMSQSSSNKKSCSNCRI